LLDNLLDNAHEYSDRAETPVSMEVRTDDGAVVIDVRDEGIGIAPEDQARLFEPFFRVDRSRTRATGGIGLGLLLARRIAEAHGGTLTIASELGKGTTATVRLPIPNDAASSHGDA
jgi:signal transduction histidine kinase